MDKICMVNLFKSKGRPSYLYSYYIKNGQELVSELQKTFYPLNVNYSKQSTVQEFEKNGLHSNEIGILQKLKT